MLIQTLVALTLLASAELPLVTHSGRPQMDVVVRSTDGESLPGVMISLCRLRSQPRSPALPEVEAKDCIVQGTGPDGHAFFTTVKPNIYAATAELSGFASTTVFPLSIASADPIAPDALVITLNPVCFHCARPKNL